MKVLLMVLWNQPLYSKKLAKKKHPWGAFFLYLLCHVDVIVLGIYQIRRKYGEVF